MNRTSISPFIALLILLFSYAKPYAQTISTIAGNGTKGYSGDGGPAISAMIDNYAFMCIDGSGNLLVSDIDNVVVRKITPSGIISTIAGIGPTLKPHSDGVPATDEFLNTPGGVATDKSGNIYICESAGNLIRKINTAGIISTIAGTPGMGGYSGDGGPATAATIQDPWGLAIDKSDNIYFSDTRYLYKINTSGILKIIAGNGLAGFSGDNGPATNAQFQSITNIAVNSSGEVYITDASNHRIRKISVAGIITTFAGNGTSGSTGDGGPATDATLSSPIGVSIDIHDNVYITDGMENVIRKVNLVGIISTVAGNGTKGFGGDGGPATSAQFHSPCISVVDGFGNMFITDVGNYRIRKVTNNSLFANDITPQTPIITLAPNPAHDKLFINSDTKIETIEVINAFGKVMYVHLDISAEKSNAVLDISSFPTGSYFVKVNDIDIKKFIKK